MKSTLINGDSEQLLLSQLPNSPLLIDVLNDAIQLSSSAEIDLIEDDNSHRHNPHAGMVITKIETILEGMIDSLLVQNELVIQLKSGRRQRRCVSQITDTGDAKSPATRLRVIRFPGKTEHEAWKFSVLLRILEASHEALVTGNIITKRDLYYRDPELFGKQQVVDRYVEDLAYTFEVERDSLNVVAAAKGLVAGELSVTRPNGDELDFRADVEGNLVPSVRGIRSTNMGDAVWILVIEKEAVFRTLALSRYWKNSRAGKGVLITGKGYPDFSTRAFLRKVSIDHPHIRVLGLFDYDPDGLGIMSTYKYGSAALTHGAESPSVSDLQWVGVSSGDCKKAQNVLKLTPRDRRKGSRMLEHDMFQTDVEPVWRRELQVMLMLNMKAEIQILGSSRELEEYLDIMLAAHSAQLAALP